MKSVYSVILLCALAGSAAHAACTYPTAPKDIPNGKTATLEKMLAAQKAVKEFDAAISAYNDCLQSDSDAEVAKLEQRGMDAEKKEKRVRKLKEVLTKKQNDAIDADKALAARFNEQLRVFKARDSKQQG